MYDVIAACHAQLGQMTEARAALDEFLRLMPEDYDGGEGWQAHLAMMKRTEDRDHWLEGYRKAGIEL